MLGTGELVLILGAGLILFGGKKLPEFARNLGEGIREFKKACNGESVDSSSEKKVQTIEKDPEKSNHE